MYTCNFLYLFFLVLLIIIQKIKKNIIIQTDFRPELLIKYIKIYPISPFHSLIVLAILSIYLSGGKLLTSIYNVKVYEVYIKVYAPMPLMRKRVAPYLGSRAYWILYSSLSDQFFAGYWRNSLLILEITASMTPQECKRTQSYRRSVHTYYL